MNSACLPNSLLPQSLLPSSAPSAAPPPTSAPPSMDHNSSLSGSEAHLSSPLRPQDKPENGLRINYEGRVSVLAHAQIYGSGNGDVSTTLDDSREERGWTTDDQMSPKEQSSSPDALPKPSIRSSDEGEGNRTASGDSLERLREICNKSLPQHGNTMIDTASNETVQPDGSTLFHCHLCSFTSTSREEFNDHVNDHYEFRCPKCEFDTKSENEYKTHLKEEHNLTPEDLDDDQGIRVPKINSQGKVKVFKCKQCEFVAVTKEDFWRHSKIHMKPEKILNCPKCCFATEYKHHLEYHLRNHFGSKPFKCPNCSYTCVNKSMLNSHMKSHTNLYQYRCADCNYATKYCHSLKLHLKKYAHKPAVVLNPDGTPNPLQIIDVYGTRRGPKKKNEGEGGASLSGSSMSPDGAKMGGGLVMPPSKSPTSPGSDRGLAAPRFPLLPPFVMAQMQMQMQQSLNQSASPTRIAQVPPFSRSINDEYPAVSPVRRLNERGDSSELEDDERVNEKEKFKCAICDFETVSHDIYRNHLMLHATKDQDSPPPPVPTSVNLPQYPLQIRSPLAINAEAKAAAAAAAASALLRRERPLSSSNESENEAPSSSIKQEEGKSEAASMSDPSLDYLEYLKKMAPLLKQSLTPSPSPMVSSTQAAPPTGSTPELISRLYFGNMVKNLSQQGYDHPQKPTQTSSSSHHPDADSSSGALDLSQLNKGDSPLPSRPQSGSQTSTTGSTGKSSRRKGKAYKIERKLQVADDRDSLNSGHSGYSNEQDPDLEVKSDGSTASGSGKEPGTTTGSNGNHHHPMETEDTASRLSKSSNLSGSHVCKFCEIAFMDSIMFTIHMGYHGFQNPYKCNMCGEEMTDKVSFFLHIARKAHQ